MSIEREFLTEPRRRGFTDYLTTRGRKEIAYGNVLKELNEVLVPYASKLATLTEEPTTVVSTEMMETAVGPASVKLQAWREEENLVVLHLNHWCKTYVHDLDYRATVVGISKGDIVFIQTGLGSWQNDNPKLPSYSNDLKKCTPELKPVGELSEQTDTLKKFVASLRAAQSNDAKRLHDVS